MISQWQSKVEILEVNRIHQISIWDADYRLTYRDVIHRWTSNEAFRKFYLSLLAGCSFDAYFWECPPLSLATVDQPYEFVLVKSQSLETIQANSAAFQNYFKGGQDKSVASFANLRGDAQLVVPCPLDPGSNYSHLAMFVKSAPYNQQSQLFQTLGEQVSAFLNEAPLWISTSGLGVYWVHLRIDTVPKYYSYRPYTHAQH